LERAIVLSKTVELGQFKTVEVWLHSGFCYLTTQ